MTKKGDLRLYLCFCLEYYTGVHTGRWFGEKPDETHCHQTDGCGTYVAIRTVLDPEEEAHDDN